MKALNQLIRASLLFLASLPVYPAVKAADLSPAQPVLVTSISGSRSTTDGFFVFTTLGIVAGCEAGFWLPVSDSNFSSVLATVKTALGLKSLIRVSGDREQLWPGSTDHYCRIVPAS